VDQERGEFDSQWPSLVVRSSGRREADDARHEAVIGSIPEINFSYDLVRKKVRAAGNRFGDVTLS
jgi:hypothetical protein